MYMQHGTAVLQNKNKMYVNAASPVSPGGFLLRCNTEHKACLAAIAFTNSHFHSYIYSCEFIMMLIIIIPQQMINCCIHMRIIVYS